MAAFNQQVCLLISDAVKVKALERQFFFMKQAVLKPNSPKDFGNAGEADYLLLSPAFQA